MKLTIRRKLTFGFGSLLAIFLITGLVVNANVRTIEKDLTETTAVEEPTSAAAYEMEINVIGTGLGDSLIAAKDRQEALFATIAKSFGKLDDIIDDQIQAKIDLAGPDGPAKYREAALTEADVAEVGT